MPVDCEHAVFDCKPLYLRLRAGRQHSAIAIIQSFWLVRVSDLSEYNFSCVT